MARHFEHYDDWKSAILECAQCGWKGTFWEGYVEAYEELMDSSCPGCDTILAIVPYPTIEESEENWGKLTDEERKEVVARKTWLAKWEAASLKSVDQLPDLPGTELILAWDWLENEQKKFTVIRHGDTEVWRELACYEGYERFREVVRILQDKYGQRLVDVVPTQASKLYLYGDRLSASQIVEDIRKSL